MIGRTLRLFISILAVSLSSAQLHSAPAFQRGELVQDSKLKGQEGVKRIDDFRRQGLNGDYVFYFDLQHMPRRGVKEIYSGVMYGSWNENGPISRIEFFGTQANHKFIIQNGPRPKVWSLEGGEAVEIGPDKINQPLWEGVIFTPFDLLRSFVYWPKYTYSGTKRVQGRPGHFFTMYPPGTVDNIKAVNIALDMSYNFLLKTEIVDDSGNIARTFKLNSFKKVQGQYILKEADLVNETTRDKTRFEVKAAALGLDIDGEYFNPSTLSKQAPPIDQRWFSRV